MAVQVDLRQLAAPREAAGSTRLVHRNRLAWLTRYVLPLVLIAGFAGALAWSFREALLPATEVTVVPVVAVRAEIEQSEAPLFQSAGWVEPRPTAVTVSALDEGVVEKLLVIEGQELKTGDVIARLIDADAKLRLRQAEAEVKSRQAELASSQAALTAAEIRLQEPIELQTKLAEAEAMLARVENELARLPSQLKAAQSRAELATQERESRLQSAGTVSKLALARAENEYQAATAAVSELAAQKTSLEKERDAQQRRVTGLGRQLELKTEEQRSLDEAKAGVDLADAQLLQAKVALDKAKLSLTRMTVYAPVDGKVLALVARPGSKVMGLAPASQPDASTIVTMYDPARLQVRADVRLEEVPRVFPGQQVWIETPAVSGVLHGEVIAATSTTDIQKNTLQVKVAVTDPPPVLKPDMLVQVTFLSPPSSKPKSEGEDSPLTLVIPPDLVQQIGDESNVWIVDRRQSVARLRAITLGGTTAEGLREVKSGLAVGDRLIASGSDTLRTGDRIRVVGEVSEQSGPQRASDHSQMKMKRL
jgi:RND family efflux transporter MFP subunit